MSKIEAIRLQNLRALRDTGFIDIKPITLLVGKNSVGKSTFARTFPLLRQSSEEKRRAPILWWGKFVDFGSFKDAVSRDSSGEEISLSFKVRIDAPHSESFDEDFWFQEFKLAEDSDVELELILSATEDGLTYIKKTIVTVCGLVCDVTLDSSGTMQAITCGSVSWAPSGDDRAILLTGELLPKFRFMKLIRTKDGPRFREFNPLEDELNKALREFAHGNTTDEKISEISKQIPIGTAQAVAESLKRISGPKSWTTSMRSLSVRSTKLERLRCCHLIRTLPEMLNYLNDEISRFSRGVRYLEPLRATAQRYYRAQELAIDEIDSKGDNLAVFIHSMSAGQLKDFNSFLRLHLNFEVSSTRDGGHISLRLRDVNHAADTNLADTGFGMSQVLPIATQLWSSMSRQWRVPYPNRETCFVIEQPELHLHPAFQEQLADLFVAAATHVYKKTRPLRIVAETHSSNLINRLGELVAEGRISREDVQVVMFDQTSADSPVEVRISDFDENGILKNWPYGFFSSGRME